jgi:hypothetical protein
LIAASPTSGLADADPDDGSPPVRWVPRPAASEQILRMMIVVGEIESPTADGRIVVAALADSLRLSVSGRQDGSLAPLLGLGVKTADRRRRMVAIGLGRC